MNAPVALFVYARLDTLKPCVAALKANLLAGESDLHIYSDGPKSDADKPQVEELRAFIKEIDGFKSVTIHAQDSNRGLAASIIAGVTEMTEQYGKVIVVEDDLVCSPYFLKFMNDALDVYQDSPKVISVSGYTLPLKGALPETYFLPGTDSWGWATWRDRWKLFNPNGAELLAQLESRKLMHVFNSNGSPIISRKSMLKAQIEGRCDSWAIRWYASSVLNGCCSLFPGRSLVDNIGFGNGTHCKLKQNFFRTAPATSPVEALKKEVTPDEGILRRVKRFVFFTHIKMCAVYALSKLAALLKL